MVRMEVDVTGKNQDNGVEGRLCATIGDVCILFVHILKFCELGDYHHGRYQNKITWDLHPPMIKSCPRSGEENRKCSLPVFSLATLQMPDGPVARICNKRESSLICVVLLLSSRLCRVPHADRSLVTWRGFYRSPAVASQNTGLRSNRSASYTSNQDHPHIKANGTVFPSGFSEVRF